MKKYPSSPLKTLSDVVNMLTYIQKERKNDVNDFEGLKDNYISGRKVAKIPSGVSDIADTDRVGDFNYDADYLYMVINDGGSAEWRRVALSTW